MDQMYSLILPLSLGIAFVFLIGTFVLTAINSAFRQIYKKDSKKTLKSLGKLFFYRSFHLYFFPKKEIEGQFFAILCAQNIARLCYTTSFMTFLFYKAVLLRQEFTTFSLIILICISIVFIIISFLLGDFLPRSLGARYPELSMRTCGPIASLFMILAFPLTFLFLKVFKGAGHALYLDQVHEPNALVKEEILDLIHEASAATSLDPHDKKLIESVVTFRDRIAREVMVPRVNVFSLPAETPIKEAAKLLKAEGYSRTPVFRNNIDSIIGVLMYKDILNKYMEYEQNGDQTVLNAPIESIVKNILYTPETKKISILLQEFRKKQVHLAIVVDEYGGTEGIVTIEDILEEIVGEIADEYDENEALFIAQKDGSWLVDARMNILDADNLLGIKIPQNGDYDTIGGYIFHRTGSIPPIGATIHHENFELEIMASNDRCVEQVRIKPLFPHESDYPDSS